MAIEAATFLLLTMTAASADSGGSYMAQLKALNGSGASGDMLGQVHRRADR